MIARHHRASVGPKVGQVGRALLGLGDVVAGQRPSVGPVRLLPALLLAAALLAGAASCTEQGAPEQVADAFAEAYFRRMDQEKAKEFTALGATAMLEAELRDVAEVRKEGYDAAEAGGRVTLRRGAPVARDHRIRIPYEVRIATDSGEVVQDADIELTPIQGAWKVVRVGLKPR